MNDENALKEFFTDNYSLAYHTLGGRANVLLYSIFKTLPQGSKIIFPAIMCPSPLIVARMAGMQAILGDVNQANGLMTEETLRESLKKHPETRAVLSVNLFGQRPRNNEFYPLCQKHNILLIEDAAQGWSPRNLGKDVDIAVLSFGSKKTVDCNGGGIVLTNDLSLHDSLCREINKIIYTSNDKIKTLSALYSRFYYLLQDWENTTPNAQKNFIQFQESLSELYLKDESDININCILNSLKDFSHNLESRYYWAKKYEAYFAVHDKFTTFMQLHPKEGPWRYSVLYKGTSREHFLNYMREKEIDISSWYPSLEKLGFGEAQEQFPRSKYFSERVLNFWVSDINEEIFKRTIEVINSFKE